MLLGCYLIKAFAVGFRGFPSENWSAGFEVVIRDKVEEPLTPLFVVNFSLGHQAFQKWSMARIRLAKIWLRKTTCLKEAVFWVLYNL